MSSEHDDYAEMRREEKKHSWIFIGAFTGFASCLGGAVHAGPGAGWNWLLWTLGALGIALWALIEYRYYSLEIRLHLLPGEIRDAMNGDDDE